jgi:hypothetical protein
VRAARSQRKLDRPSGRCVGQSYGGRLHVSARRVRCSDSPRSAVGRGHRVGWSRGRLLVERHQLRSCRRRSSLRLGFHHQRPCSRSGWSGKSLSQGSREGGGGGGGHRCGWPLWLASQRGPVWGQYHATVGAEGLSPENAYAYGSRCHSCFGGGSEEFVASGKRY